MTAFDEARELLETRLAEVNRELEAFSELLAERERLVEAIATLSGRKPARGRSRSGGPAVTRPGTRRAQVIEALRDAPGSSTSDVARRLEMSPSATTNMLSRLRADGIARTDGRQHFLTAAGEGTAVAASAEPDGGSAAGDSGTADGTSAPLPAGEQAPAA